MKPKSDNHCAGDSGKVQQPYWNRPTRKARGAYDTLKQAAADYLDAQLELVVAARLAHDAGLAVTELHTSRLDTPSEEAVIQARVETDQEAVRSEQVNGYKPALRIEDVEVQGGGPVPERTPEHWPSTGAPRISTWPTRTPVTASSARRPYLRTAAGSVYPRMSACSSTTPLPTFPPPSSWAWPSYTSPASPKGSRRSSRCSAPPETTDMLAPASKRTSRSSHGIRSRLRMAFSQ